MKFEANYLTVGTKPEFDWLGGGGTMKAEFNVAENHNYKNKQGEWITKSTSWFKLEAWGDLAQQIAEMNLTEGDLVHVKGMHKINKVQKDNDKPRYYNVYRLNEIEKYEKNNG